MDPGFQTKLRHRIVLEDQHPTDQEFRAATQKKGF